MEIFTVQDWTTISGTSTTPIVQSASDWLDLEAYADIVFWLEVAELTNPTSGTVSMTYETAPIPDDVLFKTLADVPIVSVGGPRVTKALLNGNPFIALARFVRWKLQSSTAGRWDITFRLQAAVGIGAAGSFSPYQLPNLKLWLRSDLGVSLAAGQLATWADQSGNGNDATQSTATAQPLPIGGAIGGRQGFNFATGRWLGNTSTNLISTGGTPYSVFVVAMNGSGPLVTLRQSTKYSSSQFLGTNTFVHGDGVDPSSNMTIANSSAITQSSTKGFCSAHIYNGAGANATIYLNGVAQSITSSGTFQETENGMTTGFYIGTTSASQFWNGIIAEIIVCSGAVSDAVARKVASYQANFFSL